MYPQRMELNFKDTQKLLEAIQEIYALRDLNTFGTAGKSDSESVGSKRNSRISRHLRSVGANFTYFFAKFSWLYPRNGRSARAPFW